LGNYKKIDLNIIDGYYIKMANNRIKSLDEFLNIHKTKEGEVATNTRIPNIKLNAYPGSFCIPQEDRKQFWKLYNKKVFQKKRPEHLTEIQNKEKGGPILIDLDFRFPLEVEERKFEDDLIYDLIENYCDIIKNMLELPDGAEWNTFVFLKNNINQVPEKECTKDGVHIIIGIHMHHAGQIVLRNEMVEWVKKHDFLGDLELLNSENGKKKYIDDVFDEAISTGDVGWQVYGSKKPGNESYKLKYVYKFIYKKEDDDYEVKEENEIDQYNNKAEIFSIHRKFKQYEIRDSYKEIYNKTKMEIITKLNKKKRNKTQVQSPENNQLTVGLSEEDKKEQSKYPNITLDNLNKIIEGEDLNQLSSEISKYFKSIDSNSLIVKEAHDILMELYGKYSEDYQWWIRVGWILKNIASKKGVNKILCLFVFIKFSSKWEKFSFKNVRADIIERWNEFNENGDLNFRTLHYWLQQENPMAAKRVKDKQLNTYIEKTLGLTGVFMPPPGGDGKKKRENPHIGTDWDLAKLAYCAFGDDLRCVSIKENKWFIFENHRWTECDSGHTLRSALSEKISKLYIQKQSETLEIIRTTTDQSEQEKLTTKAAIYNNIASKLKKTATKSGIFQACKTLFYEANFTDRLNENPMILIFNNGVFDFANGEFRDGRPEDMMSLTTNINYIKINKENIFHKEALNFWNNFMDTTFTDSSMRQYMWEHAAACMTGIQTQGFWMYVGEGSNGKSMYVLAINTALGEYHHTLDMSTITQKRPPNGKALPEIAELRGKRYAVMQESSKGETINEGIMKQYTGGDPIMGRALYSKPSYFIPQFKLVACTNNLFGIKSTDNGTWRRIKKVDYESKFVKGKPSGVPADKEFIMDEDVKYKIAKYIEIFASLLCDIAHRTKGKHAECEKINASSRAYKQTQDYLARFVEEKIKKSDSSIKICKNNIKQEFKHWWANEYSAGIPSKWGQELVEYLTKKLGKYERRGWHGWEIIYDTYEDEDEENPEIEGV